MNKVSQLSDVWVIEDRCAAQRERRRELGAQVALLHRFVAARREKRSLCHQLIMGQGKTTVIAPLLALMIADGHRLVISIVPPHLPTNPNRARYPYPCPVTRPLTLPPTTPLNWIGHLDCSRLSHPILSTL